MPEQYPETFYVRLRKQRLIALADSQRQSKLDRREAYFNCTQYEHLRYNWDGSMRGPSGDMPIQPGYRPLSQKKPDVRFEAARTITQRLSQMMWGKQRFPEIRVEGDDDAEDYVRSLAKESRLSSKLRQCRKLGGAQGTGVMSFSFMKGKPRVQVHNAKHMHPVRWEDKYDLRLGAVLECYKYPVTVRSKEGQPIVKDMYYCRYWDEQVEIIWDPIPREQAEKLEWYSWPKKEVTHGFGFCPVYWVQNLPDDNDVDGVSDCHGQHDKFDGMNRILSNAAKGTLANMDPTLVMHEDRKNNTGLVHKGSGQVIWAKGGASLLELKGESMRAGVELFNTLKNLAMDEAEVVIADPEQVAAKAQSAAAMRMVYQPMLVKCDDLREQWGDNAIVPLLTDMLRAAKLITGRAEGEILTTVDGRTMQQSPTVLLPDRVKYNKAETKGPPKPGERSESEPDQGMDDMAPEMVPRVPGEREEITLIWPEYFPATAIDLEKKVLATSKAAGGTTALISQRTAVEHTARDFGITNVDAELAEIRANKESALEDMLVQQDSQGEIAAKFAPADEPGGSTDAPPGKKEP